MRGFVKLRLYCLFHASWPRDYFPRKKTVTSDYQQSIRHNSTTNQHFSPETTPNDAEKLTGGHHQQPKSPH